MCFLLPSPSLPLSFSHPLPSALPSVPPSLFPFLCYSALSSFLTPSLFLVSKPMCTCTCVYHLLLTSCRHEAERLEQKAKGALERQKITDEAEAERARKELLELQANSAAVESTGQAKAEAQSRAEAAKIEGQAAVEQAKLKAQASKIEAVSDTSLFWGHFGYISV